MPRRRPPTAGRRGSRTDPGPDGTATPETHMQAAVLSLAQEMADRLTGDAKDQSQAMLSDARSGRQDRQDANSSARPPWPTPRRSRPSRRGEVLLEAARRGETGAPEDGRRREAEVGHLIADATAQSRRPSARPRRRPTPWRTPVQAPRSCRRSSSRRPSRPSTSCAPTSASTGTA